MLSVEWLLSDLLISTQIASPRQSRPSQLADRGVKVTALAGVEVSGVIEKVPFYGADESGLGLFEVDVGELEAGISNKTPAQAVLNVLQICSSSKIRERRTEAASRCSSDIV